MTIVASKSGNRLEAKECLDIAAVGKIKTHFELRPMDNLTEVRPPGFRILIILIIY